MNPLLIAAIATGVANLLGGVAKKKQANSQQSLEQKQYDDQVQTYYAEQAQEEDRRQERIRLVTAFAKANGLDSALTPEVMATLQKRREAVAPPPFRKGGTPGFGWGLAANLVNDGAAIFGAAKGAKAPTTPTSKGLMGLNPSTVASGANGFGSANPFFSRPSFYTAPSFGRP